MSLGNTNKDSPLFHMSFHGMSKGRSSSVREEEEKIARIHGNPAIITDMEGSHQENRFVFPISDSYLKI